MGKETFDELSIYVIRNHKGEWRRSDDTWVTELQNARLHANLGPARGLVTKWSNLHPKLPTLKIYVFSMSLENAVVLDETERVRQSKLDQATRAAEQQKQYAERQLALAEAEADRANRRLELLRGKR
jgi:multidrug efflux pump subunit AcrA (membrane-fusion protein)